MLCLDRLTLTDFRNYESLVWRPRERIAVLTGPNGSGKTNLLEAVSMLVPGRGLRGARLGELPRRGSAQWAVAARLAHGTDRFEIGTGTRSDAPTGRRLFLLDGSPARNRAAIAEQICAVWLTPQMDRLFSEGAAGRRRFLDRLVLALDPDHSSEVAAHDEALQSRNRLLTAGKPDAGWLSALEHSVARHAVAVTAARRSLVARMNLQSDHETMPLHCFPRVRLALECPIAERLDQASALATEDWLIQQLHANRAADAMSGGAALGAHRADLRLSDHSSGRLASLGSTGQQKCLLIGVILAHAALISGYRGEAPLLLLDEPLVHLDRTHRHALFAALRVIPAPILLSGTDREPFEPLFGCAEMIRVSDGKLDTEEGLPRPQAGSQ